MLTSNVRCGIYAPRFCNLKLYNDGYKASVSLRVSLDIYNELWGISGDYKPIEYQGRYYIHWEKSYHYCDHFFDAFEDAHQALRRMKIITRQAKIDVLTREISDLTDFSH